MIKDMQAVILAAGTGSRLGDASDGRPKCLLEVGGQSLIRHHLDALDRIGVEKILVVVGHGADQVMAEVGYSGLLQFNDIYARTNSLYSLWLARKWITGNVMVINGDVLADPQIYHELRNTDGNVLAFDSRSGTQEEEMKVKFKSDRLHKINKKMRPERAHGEHLGILKFDSAGAAALLQEADRMVGEGLVNEWAPAAVNRIAKTMPIHGIDVSRLPWTEIDFPSDLEHARKRVWPAIHGRNSGNGASDRPASNPHPQALTPSFA